MLTEKSQGMRHLKEAGLKSIWGKMAYVKYIEAIKKQQEEIIQCEQFI